MNERDEALRLNAVLRRLSHMPDEALLTPGEVALVMRVDPKTVTRWANVGKLAAIKTVGNHRRFRAGDIRALLKNGN